MVYSLEKHRARKRNGAQPIRPKAHTNVSARDFHLILRRLADQDPSATPVNPDAQVITPNIIDTLKEDFIA